MGGLLLLLSTDSSDEPRNQINDTPRSQMVFGVTVDGWKPGETAVVDDERVGLPDSKPERRATGRLLPCRRC